MNFRVPCVREKNRLILHIPVNTRSSFNSADLLVCRYSACPYILQSGLAGTVFAELVFELFSEGKAYRFRYVKLYACRIRQIEEGRIQSWYRQERYMTSTSKSKAENHE